MALANWSSRDPALRVALQRVAACPRPPRARVTATIWSWPASQEVGRVAVATVRNMITRSNVKGLTMLPILSPWIAQSGMLI